jgi:hypothetical protein
MNTKLQPIQIVLILIALGLLAYAAFGSKEEFFQACNACRANRVLNN